MDLRELNFRDLVLTYFNRTTAAAGLEWLESSATGADRTRLALVLRHHKQRPVTDDREILRRDSIDALLDFCSMLELASLAGYVDPTRQDTLTKRLLTALDMFELRQYYERFYAIRSPTLLRARLTGHSRDEATNTSSHLVTQFLSLDRRFRSDNNLRTFLLLLDDYTLEGIAIEHLRHALTTDPTSLSSSVLLRPSERSPLAQAVLGFGTFLTFCLELDRLLSDERLSPTVASACWHYYNYWFVRIRVRIGTLTSEALAQFAAWVEAAHSPASDDLDDILTFKATVATLLSDRFSEPIESRARQSVV